MKLYSIQENRAKHIRWETKLVCTSPMQFNWQYKMHGAKEKRCFYYIKYIFFPFQYDIIATDNDVILLYIYIYISIPIYIEKTPYILIVSLYIYNWRDRSKQISHCRCSSNMEICSIYSEIIDGHICKKTHPVHWNHCFSRHYTTAIYTSNEHQ